MAKKKKPRRPARKPARPLSKHLVEGLDRAQSLMNRGRTIEARDLLQELDARYPRREEVLGLLVNVTHDLQDAPGFLEACQRLVAVRPSADFTLMLGGAYLLSGFAALGLRTFRHFLQRWPDHPGAATARASLAKVEPDLPDRLAQINLTGDDGLEAMALHEEVQVLLGQGNFPEARRKAEGLLRRRPDFTPALNNLGETFFREGRPDEAVATARRVLGIDPDNLHALSNLARYLLLAGRTAEARECGERLRAVEPKGNEHAAKKAEGLSYLGDDAGVRETYRQYQELRPEGGGRPSAFLLHLVAVAEFRLGREDEARRHWAEALREEPGFEPARENLDDLRKPLGERHAPWPFPLPNWAPEKLVKGLVSRLAPFERTGRADAVAREATAYLREHPAMAALLPILLDRGDPAGRELAVRVAGVARSPETLALLRDFALGQRGPDAMRMEAAQLASQAKLLPPGPARLWVEGAWRDLLLFGWEVHGEPIRPPGRSSQTEELSRQALEALRERDAARAESLIRKALEAEPDAPDLLQNLAAANELQGRSAESEALLRQIHQRFPDYLFARAVLARLAARQGRPDEGKALLDPLLTRPRFHFSEFAAVCAAMIDVLLAKGEKDGARTWFDMWERTEPDNPQLDEFRGRVRTPRWVDRLTRWRE
jgi:tetratricopeptide (TPR) repeat protein